MDSEKAHQRTTTVTFVRERLNGSYFKTIPGILKCAQMLAGLIGVIFTAFAGYGDYTGLKAFESTFGISATITFLLLWLYVCNVVLILLNQYWYLIEFIYCSIAAILYLVTSSMVATKADVLPVLGGGAFFGYVATLLYGVDAFLKFRGWRAGDAPGTGEGGSNPV